MISQPIQAERWFYVFGAPLERARVALVCLPCAGGSAAMYRQWSDGLPADVSLVTIRLPGREARLDEPAHLDMAGFVRDLLPVLQGLAGRPYALFGHSMGALMAYELMRRWPADTRPPVAVFLSAHRPPHLDLGRPPIYDHPKQAFLKAVREMGGLPDEVWSHPEFLDLVEPTMRADFTLCETFPRGPEVHRDVRLDMPVLVFGGRQDRTAEPSALERWTDLCADHRGLTIWPGGHFYLREHRVDLLDRIAKTLLG